MTDTKLVRLDDGAVNARILARAAKEDFRRVEAASVKMRTQLASPDGKRVFVRCFPTLQLNAHFVSIITRTRLADDEVEPVEAALREKLERVSADLNAAIDSAELLFKTHGVSNIASADTQPLALEVGIVSSLGRRYFELIHKLDQLMPLLQTLEIHELITSTETHIQRAKFKRAVRAVAGSARNFASGLRRRMNALGRDNTARAPANARGDETAHPADAAIVAAGGEAPATTGEVLNHGPPAEPALSPPDDSETAATQRKPPRRAKSLPEQAPAATITSPQ